jgi:epoxyqueuosine reductase
MPERPGRRARLTGGFFHRLHMRIARTGVPDVIAGPRFRSFLRWLPPLPRWLRTRLGTEPPLIPRSLAIPELPPELRTAPGIVRDRGREIESRRQQGPLPVWLMLHHESTAFFRRQQWRLDLLTYRGIARATSLIEEAPSRLPQITPEPEDPAELTKRVKAKAAELRISAVGVAQLDPMVSFTRPTNVGKRDPMMAFEAKNDLGDADRAIVCIVEQNWASHQTLPSFRGERAHYNAVVRLRELSSQLAAWLRDLGYIAAVHGDHGANIAYAVAAGLGQLGLNGQLLTPFAGPRIRLNVIITNAPLLLDEPVDYGVPAVCDACKACVRNCPTGAIRSKREYHRGVYKAKIKVERCVPMVSAVHGCAVCHKVCPIQRYGLPAVIDEYKRSGEILGKGTDELEGYVWPPDGRYYGPGERPPSAVTEEWLNPRGFFFDPARTLKVIVSETAETGGMEG